MVSVRRIRPGRQVVARWRAELEEHDVERIIKGVLDDLEAPFSLVVLNRTATGWDATFKTARGGLIVVALPDGPPSSIRAAVAQRIEAEVSVW
jgi:hypothetical protein